MKNGRFSMVIMNGETTFSRHVMMSMGGGGRVSQKDDSGIESSCHALLPSQPCAPIDVMSVCGSLLQKSVTELGQSLLQLQVPPLSVHVPGSLHWNSTFTFCWPAAGAFTEKRRSAFAKAVRSFGGQPASGIGSAFMSMLKNNPIPDHAFPSARRE